MLSSPYHSCLLYLKDRSCKLAIGSKDNIVATGTILEYRKPYVLVSLHMPLCAEALLPFQNNEDLIYVSDAVGHQILWPENLVVSTTNVEEVIILDFFFMICS